MKARLLLSLALALTLGAVAQDKTKATTTKPAAKPAAAKTAPAPMAPSTGNVKTFVADKIQWGPAPDAFPPGAQAAVLEGDPTKPGIFTMRVKFPNGYKVAPHSHPKQE